MNEIEFSNLVKSKKVVIVGPADYVDNHKTIQSYDIIIRLNRGIGMESTGKCGDRTDILYHAVCTNPENGGPLPEKNTTHVRFAYPYCKPGEICSFKRSGTIREFHTVKPQLKTYNNYSIIPKEKYIEFEHLCDKSRPNTGMVAILDMLSLDIEELYITGFTLFQSNYCKSYRELVDGKEETGKQARDRMLKTGFHNQWKQANVFRNYIMKHEKIKFDKELETAVNSILQKY